MPILLLALLGQFDYSGAVAEPFPRRVIPSAMRPADQHAERIAELEAEVARLREELAQQSPGEWRTYEKNPAYEVYGREIDGEFHFIASRRKPPRLTAPAMCFTERNLDEVRQRFKVLGIYDYEGYGGPTAHGFTVSVVGGRFYVFGAPAGSQWWDSVDAVVEFVRTHQR